MKRVIPSFAVAILIANLFTDSGLTQLSDFRALVESWLASKASSDWVQ